MEAYPAVTTPALPGTTKHERRTIPGDPWKYIALAVIHAAIIDTRRGDPEALAWLLDVAPEWLDLCEVNFSAAAWRVWVKSRCPKRHQRALYGTK